MQIVFNRAVADQLKEKYLVLELETIPVDGQMLEAFCVVPLESIVFELASMNENTRIHEQFVAAIKNNQPDECLSLGVQLKGKFNGELDSFYDIIMERCRTNNNTTLVLPS